MTVKFPSGSGLKNLPAVQDTRVGFLSWEDPLEEEIATHPSILAGTIPWTRGALSRLGSQRVEHDWLARVAKSRTGLSS